MGRMSSRQDVGEVEQGGGSEEHTISVDPHGGSCDVCSDVEVGDPQIL